MIFKLTFNAVGNHEFDRGTDELRRLQNGGCQQYTSTAPCQINKNFSGAKFNFLAANVAMKMIQVKRFFLPIKSKLMGIPAAFIGLTLQSDSKYCFSGGY